VANPSPLCRFLAPPEFSGIKRDLHSLWLVAYVSLLTLRSPPPVPRRLLVRRPRPRAQCFALIIGSAAAFSASNPQVCSDVTCSMVVPHTCAYSTSNYGGSVFSSLIGAKHGTNDGCDNRVHSKGVLNSCNGAYQWAGAAAKASNHACDGSTHKSMRITHNGKAESVCNNGHRCKIGLASGTANCECVPVCSIGDVYRDGACRSRLSGGSNVKK